MDTISILVVTVPILDPIVESLGINPILYAVIIIKLLEIAAVSPLWYQSIRRAGRHQSTHSHRGALQKRNSFHRPWFDYNYTIVDVSCNLHLATGAYGVTIW